MQLYIYLVRENEKCAMEDAPNMHAIQIIVKYKYINNY